MKEYKRLTEILDIETKEIAFQGNINTVLKRLAELEDKIENGTLFSIPFIRKHPKVENAFVVVYESEHGDLMGKMFCGENAKAEAEAKLKELQGE